MVVLAAVADRPHAKRIVTTGLDLVERRETALHVFHVVGEAEAKRRIERRDDYYLDTATEDARKTALSFVEEVTPDTSGIRVSGHVGDPGDVIEAQVDRHDPSYLVVGGRKRSPVGKALLGSVLQETLLSAKCPVVTVMQREN